MGMGSEMVGFPIARSSTNSAARLLGSACTDFPKLLPKMLFFGRVAEAPAHAGPMSGGKKAAAPVACLGNEEYLSGGGGGGDFEAGTAGATRLGVGQMTGVNSTLTLSLVRVNTDPVAQNPLSIAVAILCWFCLKTLAILWRLAASALKYKEQLLQTCNILIVFSPPLISLSAL